jgi:hypothetical protein
MYDATKRVEDHRNHIKTEQSRVMSTGEVTHNNSLLSSMKMNFRALSPPGNHGSSSSNPLEARETTQHNTTSMPNAQIKRVLTMLSFLQHMNCMAVTPRPGRKRDTTSSMGNKQDQKTAGYALILQDIQSSLSLILKLIP